MSNLISDLNSRNPQIQIFTKSRNGHLIRWNDPFVLTNADVSEWFESKGFTPKKNYNSRGEFRCWQVRVPKAIAAMAKLTWGGAA